MPGSRCVGNANTTIAFGLALAIESGGCTFDDDHRDPHSPADVPGDRLPCRRFIHPPGGRFLRKVDRPRPSRSTDGDTLQLFVTRLAADSDKIAADPVLSLGGDLGVATDYVTLGAQLEGLGREVITLDARGTGRSTPSLVCPEVEALPHAPVEVPVDDPRTRRDSSALSPRVTIDWSPKRST